MLEQLRLYHNFMLPHHKLKHKRPHSKYSSKMQFHHQNGFFYIFININFSFLKKLSGHTQFTPLKLSIEYNRITQDIMMELQIFLKINLFPAVIKFSILLEGVV